MDSKQAESLIAGAFFGTAIALGVGASSAGHWIGGFTSWGVAEALRHRRGLGDYSEVFTGSINYVRSVLGDVAAVATPVTEQAEQTVQEVVVSALRQIPLCDRLADQFVAEKGLSTDWFEGFEKRSAAICGESKDGKTFLSRWRLHRFLTQNPDGQAYVCDIDYGSSHEGAEPNDWFGLPVGSVVFIDPESITNVIRLVNKEVNKRARDTAIAVQNKQLKPTFPPVLLLVDEWNTYISSLAEKEQEEVVTMLRNICDRGIKQGNVVFVLGLHDMSVGATKIPVNVLKKLELVMLYRASQSKRNYGNLDVEPRDAEDTVSQMKALPKMVKDMRPCVVFSEKSLSIKAIPPLQMSDVRFVAEPSEAVTDPDQEWLDLLWTAELEAEILGAMMGRLMAGKDPIALSEFWKLAGQPQKEQLNTNPKYQLFKTKIQNLAASIPNPEKLEIIGNGKLGSDRPVEEVTANQALSKINPNPFTF